MTVVIAGAGPTGLALACGLLRSGVDVRIVDAAAGPAQSSRAIGVQPRSLDVLRRLGALDGLPERAIRMQRFIVHVEGKPIVDVPLTALFDRAKHPPPMLISQVEVESTLRKRVEELGGAVEWGVGVENGTQDDAGVRIDLSSGETVTAEWLVGCDGAHSRVRKICGAAFPGGALEERFLLADLHADGLGSRVAARTWIHADGVLVVFPLPGRDDLWRLIASVPTRGATDLDADEIVARLAAALHDVAGMPDATVQGVEWTSNFGISQRLVSTYRSGRVLLAGDAAHIHSPVGGQGMNTGIGDAENLAWKLALVVDGIADPALLDTYESERRPIATKVLARTGAVTRAALARNPVVRVVRTKIVPTLAPLVAGRRFVQDRVVREVSQMGVTYRRGRFGSGLQSGDPVPDFTTDDGPLFEHLGTGWAVVARANSDVERCAAVAGGTLGRQRVAMLTTTDPRLSEVVLVRPDGHLGWRGTDPARLGEWLSRYVTSPMQ